MIYDLFKALMNDINSTMIDVVNDKKGHNIVNNIRQTALLITKTAYLFNCFDHNLTNTCFDIDFERFND